MMLECCSNYLLRENKQLMECHQQKLHLQHMRAAYQDGHCWAQATIASIELPSPSEWGLNKNTDGEAWEVHWTTLLEATQELIRCGCKKGCIHAEDSASDRKLLSSALPICFCGELCGD